MVAFRIMKNHADAAGRKVDFELSLFGQKFSKHPVVFDEILDLLHVNGKAGEIGFVESRTEYLARLSAHDFVLSTADQEFQGLAILTTPREYFQSLFLTWCQKMSNY